MDKKKNNCCTYEVKIVTFAALGVILVVAGGVLIPVFKKVINDKIKEVGFSDLSSPKGAA